MNGLLKWVSLKEMGQNKWANRLGHTKMDVLSKAYPTASDSDEDDDGGGVSEHWNPFPPPPKRPRPETLSANPIRPPSHHAEALIPGRYISKRQIAAASDPIPHYVAPSPGNFMPLLNVISCFVENETDLNDYHLRIIECSEFSYNQE